MSKKTIQYAIDTETGLVISRYGDEIAFPELQYKDMNSKNKYTAGYILQKTSVFAVAVAWDYYKWTRKIPVEIKNKHREFWGFKPIK
jgi:hypothetical protein